MYNAIILPEAKEDIRESAIWYNSISFGLGKKFTSEIKEEINFIKQNPNSSNIRYDDIRTRVLNTFPYMIHYIVDETNETIVVLAVLHTSRNPKIWKKR